jgi:murein L,D-transpeptidase YcbB/YkuD
MTGQKPLCLAAQRWRIGLLASAIFFSALPSAAWSQPAGGEPTLVAELQRLRDAELEGVYAARAFRPLWIGADGALDPAASRLVELIETSALDGLDPDGLPHAELTAALNRMTRDGSPQARLAAELALSRALVDYVRAMAGAHAEAMTYEHQSLRPATLRRADILWAASNAPSLTAYVETMGWMHPLYAALRKAALAEGAQADPTVLGNLARLRALPAPGKGKSILVDAANARLWMYEDGRAVDSMKVVVGKPETQTPLLAGYVRYAILNPYWNVPDNLVAGSIASKVLSRGPGYLKTAGYEVLSDWSADAAPVDPATIDWRKVAAGASEVRVRQRPGAYNAMGRVKFEFPNPMGIYLHDTPDKQLMLKEQRQFSNGCVRLEDADRLGRWLMGGGLPAAAEPETKVSLPAIVPVYITYLTVNAEAGRLAFGPDPYRRNQGVQAFAQRAEASPAAAR